MSIFKKKTHRTIASYQDKLLSEDTPFAVKEAYNTLRANLMFTCVNEKCPVFGVVSALPNSGKSLTSANLAIAFSMIHKKVLLIDGDMRKPAQSRCFNAHDRLYFSELLSGQVALKDAVVEMEQYPNLSVIFTGKTPPNPQELLSSERTAALFEELKKQYDVIVVDFPPINIVADAMLLSNVINGYLLVVMQGVSETTHVKKAVEMMKQMNCNLIGTVMNGVDIKSDEYYKKHGTNYYYYSYLKKE